MGGRQNSFQCRSYGAIIFRLYYQGLISRIKLFYPYGIFRKTGLDLRLQHLIWENVALI